MLSHAVLVVLICISDVLCRVFPRVKFIQDTNIQFLIHLKELFLFWLFSTKWALTENQLCFITRWEQKFQVLPQLIFDWRRGDCVPDHFPWLDHYLCVDLNTFKSTQCICARETTLKLSEWVRMNERLGLKRGWGGGVSGRVTERDYSCSLG